MCVIPQRGYKTQSPLSSQMKNRRRPETVGGKLSVPDRAGCGALPQPPAPLWLLGFVQQIPSRIRVTEPREGSCNSPSLEVWVSLNIMGGGAVLIAAR